LNQIWQVGADTLRVNLTDGYTDTPWRERGQWWGDAFISSQINRVTFNEQEMLKRGITFMAQGADNGALFGLSPNGENLPMVDYGMLWVFNLNEYAHESQDIGFLYRLFPAVEKFLLYLESFRNAQTGLLELPDSHWSQTAYIDTLGMADRKGQSTAVNALYYGTLRQASQLAIRVNRPDLSLNWYNQAQIIRSKINEHLYLTEEQAYTSALVNSQLQAPSVLAQAYALSYEVVATDRQPAVIQSMLNLLGEDPQQSKIGTYGFYWVINALGKFDYTDEALDLIRLYYGYMLDQGATTWWEWFGALNNYQNSLSHAWSGSPTWFLSSHVLGVQVTGENTWSLTIPQASSVEWAEGSLPLGDSAVSVRWEKTSCGGMVLSVSSPTDSKGILVLPHTIPPSAVYLNHSPAMIFNQSLNEERSEQPLWSINIAGGQQQINIIDACGETTPDKLPPS
jgi:alpha-L-rhamnosidase